MTPLSFLKTPSSLVLKDTVYGTGFAMTGERKADHWGRLIP